MMQYFPDAMLYKYTLKNLSQIHHHKSKSFVKLCVKRSGDGTFCGTK